MRLAMLVASQSWNAVEQDRKLVAAQTRDHVNFADAAFQSARHCDQQLVADRVAQTIVYVLETIEVKKQDRELIILSLLRAFHDEFQVLPAAARFGRFVSAS